MPDEKQDLESRVAKLEDMEAIRAVKHKYWRCIDKEIWDELGLDRKIALVRSLADFWPKEGVNP